MKGAIADLDRRLASLDDAQSAVEMEISDPDKLEEDIDATDQFAGKLGYRGCKLPRCFWTLLRLSNQQVSQPSVSVVLIMLSTK